MAFVDNAAGYNAVGMEGHTPVSWGLVTMFVVDVVVSVLFVRFFF